MRLPRVRQAVATVSAWVEEYDEGVRARKMGWPPDITYGYSSPYMQGYNSEEAKCAEEAGTGDCKVCRLVNCSDRREPCSR